MTCNHCNGEGRVYASYSDQMDRVLSECSYCKGTGGFTDHELSSSKPAFTCRICGGREYEQHAKRTMPGAASVAVMYPVYSCTTCGAVFINLEKWSKP